jgi:hypothetical protein
LKTVEAARKVAIKNREKVRMESTAPNQADSRDALTIDPRGALIELANTSYEFADLLRKILPRFVLQPIQALDSGQVHPRALLTLDLSCLLPTKDGVPMCQPEDFEIDVFEAPVHIKHLAAVIEAKKATVLRGEKHTLALLAGDVGIHRMTVKRALAYHRLMEAEGLDEPFRVLSVPPPNAPRWKARGKERLTCANVT